VRARLGVGEGERRPEQRPPPVEANPSARLDATAILRLQQTAGNTAVGAILRKNGTETAPEQKKGHQVTIRRLTVANPGLFLAMADFGSETPRLVIDDSMAPTAEFDGEEYVQIAQMCSIMSVYWLQDSSSKKLKDLDPVMQAETGLIVYRNQTPDAQLEFAKALLGFQEVGKQAVTAALGDSEDKEILLYSPRHVSAAKVTGGKIVYFDPERGEEAEITRAEFGLYLAAANRFLVG
jgi:hypothetical protein